MLDDAVTATLNANDILDESHRLTIAPPGPYGQAGQEGRLPAGVFIHFGRGPQ